MSQRKLDISDVIARFPEFRVAAIVAEWDAAPSGRSAALAEDVARREADCRARWAGTELSAIPGVAAWRSAYRGFGIKKTSYRSSVERLIKRVLAGDSLPAIHPLVDIYNMVSLTSGLCLGADDLDKTEGDLAFRFARAGDSFVDMAAAPGENPDDPPKDGEVVYACAAHILCRRWNWRQDARTVVGPATRRAVITAQSNGVGAVEEAGAEVADWIGRELGGRCSVIIAEKGRESVAVGG